MIWCESFANVKYYIVRKNEAINNNTVNKEEFLQEVNNRELY